MYTPLSESKTSKTPDKKRRVYTKEQQDRREPIIEKICTNSQLVTNEHDDMTTNGFKRIINDMEEYYRILEQIDTDIDLRQEFDKVALSYKKSKEEQKNIFTKISKVADSIPTEADKFNTDDFRITLDQMTKLHEELDYLDQNKFHINEQLNDICSQMSTDAQLSAEATLKD
jgi:hypothetical protein